ncbi:uncharacterized protein LOC110719905 [Chenopodium quinoa]|uniref:uncharacterized protein LOC110719905 n=1 Tax=Chenopodium quinoa TaxID=63459 RepID=UPI000B7873C4|nr:uncharacterized protein LOC110719905 [Chenopodium quinoa]
MAVNYVSKWVEVTASPTNDHKVVLKLFKKIIFPSGQVDVSNRQIKLNFEKTIARNRKIGRNSLMMPFGPIKWPLKNPTSTTHYRLVYVKSCHLPVELEHHAQWAIKKINFDLASAGEQRWVDLHELEELRFDAYDCASIYKARSKEINDKLIKKKEFNDGDKVLLYNSKIKLFPGKLMSRRSSSFLVQGVFPHGVVKISPLDSSSSFKVNGHRLKRYYDGVFVGLVHKMFLYKPP